MVKKRISVIGYGVLGALLHAMKPGQVECLEYRSREDVVGTLDREAPFTYSIELLRPFIQKIPLMSAFLQLHASVVQTVDIYDEEGCVTSKRLAAPRYSFTRRDLMNWFVSHLSPSESSVRFNQKVLKIDPQEKNIVVEDMPTLKFDVLVIANGIFSTLLQEKCLLQDPHRSFIKLDAVPMTQTETLEVYHHEKGFVIRYPLGASRSVCLWSTPTETLTGNPHGLTRKFESDFPSLYPQIPELNEQFRTHPVTPILYRAPHQEVHHTEIVMGDARAAVFPSGGLGADFMLETVLTLCKLVDEGEDGGNVVDAFYERHPYSEVEGLFQQSLDLAVRGAFVYSQ